MIRISNDVPIAHRQTNHRTATPVSINELLWVREFLHQLKQMGQAKNVHEGRTIANPVQQSQTIIEIRPYRSGWQCFEGPGVQPYWTGENAKQSAIDYAKARAKFARGEIRVLNPDRSVERTIPFDE